MENVATVEQRKSGKTNWMTIVPIVIFHIMAIWALFTFSWTNLAVGLVVWWLAGSLGIGIGYHRQLTHRGFKTPKWLENLLAVFGSMALQGSPNNWVTTHRVHHAFYRNRQRPAQPAQRNLLGAYGLGHGRHVAGQCRRSRTTLYSRFDERQVLVTFYELLVCADDYRSPSL